MSVSNENMWQDCAQAYAFLGNSLLKPMSQTSSIGLDPEFWAEFPDFGSAEVRHALDECEACVKVLADECGSLEAAIQKVSVEYTRLFVGPPSPAAAPWETIYRGAGTTVGFGEATFEMRRLLRGAGLSLTSDNNQYEDHMGIELLYLSVLCQRVAEAASGEQTGESALAVVSEQADENTSAVALGQAGGSGSTAAFAQAASAQTEIEQVKTDSVSQVAEFIVKHPASWIDAFIARVEESCPGGYIVSLLKLEKAILVASLAACE